MGDKNIKMNETNTTNSEILKERFSSEALLEIFIRDSFKQKENNNKEK